MCGLGVERMQKRKAEQYPFMTCYHHFSGYSIRSQYISPWQSSLRSHPSVENTEIISIKFLSEIFTAINATYRCHKEWLVKMLNWNSAHTERNKNLPQNSFSSTHTTLLNAMRPTTMAVSREVILAKHYSQRRRSLSGTIFRWSVSCLDTSEIWAKNFWRHFNYGWFYSSSHWLVCL